MHNSREILDSLNRFVKSSRGTRPGSDYCKTCPNSTLQQTRPASSGVSTRSWCPPWSWSRTSHSPFTRCRPSAPWSAPFVLTIETGWPRSPPVSPHSLSSPGSPSCTILWKPLWNFLWSNTYSLARAMATLFSLLSQALLPGSQAPTQRLEDYYFKWLNLSSKAHYPFALLLASSATAAVLPPLHRK